ncbi:hypothetical protein [Microvirga antarctica]|uniref:hypothetical protein n=1 Tax=Microvirga antarctica TaxID=2819233 RepID=UPI001B312545|nr:hypothetical protein [Microvirga antarctica]
MIPLGSERERCAALADAYQALNDLRTVRVELLFDLDGRKFAFMESEGPPHSDEECAEFARIKGRIRTDRALREALPTLLTDHTAAPWARQAEGASR